MRRRGINFDTLNKVLLAVSFLFLFLPGTYFKVLAGVFLCLFMIRAYSRDAYKMEQQNQTFRNFFYGIKSRFTSRKARGVETFDAEGYTREQEAKQRAKEEKKREKQQAKDAKQQQKQRDKDAKAAQKANQGKGPAKPEPVATHSDATHVFLNCPNCGKQLRLPKGKGKLNVTCPHCSYKFQFDTSK
ncbi:zinc-ribbon domain-containing protein [Eubacteriales bacterium OttesenSCG-928-N14]|nr:zinc-ribbon domain-containing protein [Eubacteriales bacterium OttesenSCG-928-N14]